MFGTTTTPIRTIDDVPGVQAARAASAAASTKAEAVWAEINALKVTMDLGADEVDRLLAASTYDVRLREFKTAKAEAITTGRALRAAETEARRVLEAEFIRRLKAAYGPLVKSLRQAQRDNAAVVAVLEDAEAAGLRIGMAGWAPLRRATPAHASLVENFLAVVEQYIASGDSL